MNNYKYYILPVIATIMLSACTDYLTPPPESAKSEADIFGNYSSFQAYTDQIYLYVTDPMDMAVSDACFGGEAIGSLASTTGNRAIIGDYYGFEARGFFGDGSKNVGHGIWYFSWPGIRIANIGLKNIDYLLKSSATEEQKSLIKGQLYFFRAYFHFELLSAWGSIPYINTVMGGGELDKPRFYEYKGKHNYQACTEYIVQDLDSAARYLPASWPSDLTDRGHATKFAALGYKARALLYAGSPLMNEASGNAAVVDEDYMKRAADAAWELIILSRTTYLADGTKACDLMPMSQYEQMFATTDGTHPWKQENIWGKYRFAKGKGNFTGGPGKIHVPDPTIFGGGQLQTITQNYTDIFEMADGTLYKPEYDSINSLRWNFRDPRFRQSIYVDRDNAGLDPTKTILALYSSGGPLAGGVGQTKSQSSCFTPYIIHKFWPKGVNVYDGSRTGSTLYNNFQYMVPLMRLAEIYLIYAESVNEGYGSPTATAPGADLTAVDAVNVIRQRAYQGAKFNGNPIPCPLATATATAYQPAAATGGPGAFTRLVLNENAVETTFEGRYWYDLRRWKLGDKFNQTPVYDLRFDKNWTPTSFQRVKIATRIFEAPKHYWMPFPLAQTQMYVDFPQNTGW
ncbi:MAG: RagB/SusD family nutrient uptake outer membrane protein [Bacteroidia bacterium]|nr:RagB/SusD family nutrient uptake outer membrane protein [Bacteroidia bacterium]